MLAVSAIHGGLGWMFSIPQRYRQQRQDCERFPAMAHNLPQSFLNSEVQLCELGSNRQQEEAKILGYWRDYLPENEEQQTGFSLQDILIFATGLTSLPPATLLPRPRLRKVLQLSSCQHLLKHNQRTNVKKLWAVQICNGLWYPKLSWFLTSLISLHVSYSSVIQRLQLLLFHINILSHWHDIAIILFLTFGIYLWLKTSIDLESLQSMPEVGCLHMDMEPSLFCETKRKSKCYGINLWRNLKLGGQ